MRLKVLFSDEDFDRGKVVDAALGTLPDGRIMVRANGSSGCEHRFYYDSIDSFIEDWADPYEEPKTCWYLNCNGEPTEKSEIANYYNPAMIEIGNYFETEAEAEQAVEKLKAFTKLCKKGFEFNSVEMFGSGFIKIKASIPISEKTTLQERSDITDSLYLLFGGEE